MVVGRTHRGIVCEGDVPSAIKQASRERRLREMRNGAGRKVRDIAKSVEMSNESMRKVRCTGNKVSTRFRIRALSDSLPTYQNEAQKVSESEANIYTAMYGDSISGGMCMCGKGVESMQHIMVECEEHSEERNKAIDKIKKIWQKNRNTRTDWGTLDYITDNFGGDWKQWWGWLGLVPESLLIGQKVGQYRR